VDKKPIFKVAGQETQSEIKVGEQKKSGLVFKVGGQEIRSNFQRQVGKKPCSVSKVGEKPVQVQSRWARNLVHIQGR
jgi:hypothetical protein